MTAMPTANTAMPQVSASGTAGEWWASLAIPLVRAFVRYAPPSAAKQRLWDGLVVPYLAWRDHRFIADTVAGQIAGTTTDILQQYLYYFGTWEPQVTAFTRARLRPGDVFVDVGANIGFFSLLGARAVGTSGAVVSIEASPRIFSALCDNIHRNHAGGTVRALNLAASDAPGTLALFAGDRHNCGAATIAAGPNMAIDTMVVAARLDDVLSANEAQRARLVKLDVEGAEAAVVAGMPGLIRGPEREFLIEIHPEQLARLGRAPQDVLGPFHDASYHPYVLDNDYDATGYLWPTTACHRPRRLRQPIQWDTNVVFSRIDAEEL